MLRSLVLMELGCWDGTSEEIRQRRWECYLEGVRNYQLHHWGDNFTLLAISGVLRRVIIVFSVATKTLARYEVEPPVHWCEEKISGLPVILSHYGDHHYLPVRVNTDGPWGWVLGEVHEEVGKLKKEQIIPKGQNPNMVVEVDDNSGPMSGRTSLPQRRSGLPKQSPMEIEEEHPGQPSAPPLSLRVGIGQSQERWSMERALRGKNSRDIGAQVGTSVERGVTPRPKPFIRRPV